MQHSIQDTPDFHMAEYLEYLANSKDLSPATLSAYGSDLQVFIQSIMNMGCKRISEVTEEDIRTYFLRLKQKGKSPATVARNLATCRSFFGYLNGTGKLAINPILEINLPRIQKPSKENTIALETLDRLATLPDQTQRTGARDHAIIQMIGNTRMNLSELLSLRIEDVNLELGYVRCMNSDMNQNPKFIQLDDVSRQSLERHLGFLHYMPVESPLFGNGRGSCLTRQGVWKIIKRYGARLEDGNGASTTVSPRDLKQKRSKGITNGV